MGGRYGGSINGRDKIQWRPQDHPDIQRIPPTAWTQPQATRNARTNLKEPNE